MMVTDIIKPLVIYTDDWYGEQYEPIEKALSEYNGKKSRFTVYTWGLFVTSYARRNLYSGILEFGSDYIYSDTDSIKCFNIEKHMPYIKAYNKWITSNIDKVLDSYGISPEEARPKNKKGEIKQIGVWDWETEKEPYTEFKTLGAKRYMYKQGDQLHITIAGVSKKMGCEYISKQKNPFDFFNDDMEISKDFSGKLTHTYIDDERSGTLIDYNGVSMNYHELSAVHLEKSSYKLSLLDDFEDFCHKKKKGIKEFYG